MLERGLFGAVAEPDGEGRAGGGDCDDLVRFTLRFDGAGRLSELKVGVDGCPGVLAAAAELARRARGLTLLAAARLGVQTVLDADPAAAAAPRCARVAVDAFHAALGDAVARGRAPVAAGDRVLVAMSGGVDSAVAMAAAVATGAEVVGVTLKLWIDPDAPETDRACCAPAAVRAARDACHARGAAHIALDLSEAFRSAVVQPFIVGYAAGGTPNPCVRCNGAFRFDALVEAADRLGARRLWTGHYARIVERDGRSLIARGADPQKDQSYMLAGLRPELIARLVFPLGAQTKAATRERAAALGLAAALAPESQEVCFLGGGDYRGFLRRHGVEFRPGRIETEAGAVVGAHAGTAGFTPGQRRGVGVSAEEPLYVLRTEPERDAVIVAPRGRLGSCEVRLRELVLHVPAHRVDAKLRYRSPAVPAALERRDGEAVLVLDREVFAVAPGQTAALYDGDVVVGSGTIA